MSEVEREDWRTAHSLRVCQLDLERALRALRLMANDFAPELKITDPDALVREYIHRAYADWPVR